MILCGAHGCEVADTKHDDEAAAHMKRMNRAYRDEHGEWAPCEMQADWFVEGLEAARRRMTVREFEAVRAAEALLVRHGYTVLEPDGAVSRGTTNGPEAE